MEEAPYAILLTDVDRRIAWVNRAGRELLGDEAVHGVPFLHLFGEAANERSGAFATTVVVPKTGRVFTADVAVRTLADGSLVAAVRERQEKSADAPPITDRLAALGALSAGVAHELNNPLTYVILRLDIISSIASRAARLVAGVGAAADRYKVELAGLVSDLADHVTTAKEGTDRMRVLLGKLRALAQSEGDPPFGSHVREGERRGPDDEGKMY